MSKSNKKLNVGLVFYVNMITVPIIYETGGPTWSDTSDVWSTKNDQVKFSDPKKSNFIYTL